ncbi:hypothetical protein HY333_01475 [Candidatus Collierbacteria bacterium]|nr:hypothetical protein [Candidatus Collierbacteria bacterium]
MPASTFKKINLIPKDSFEFSLLGKSMKWALTVGRVLVVLTEFVVILAFTSRFWFDKKLNDLSEAIDQKQVVVRSYSQVELQMRDILARQNRVSEFVKSNLKIGRFLDDVVNITPVDVFYEQIVLRGDSRSLSGKSGTPEGLAQLISRVKKMEEIGSVNVGEVSFDQKEGNIVFVLNLGLKKGKNE